MVVGKCSKCGCEISLSELEIDFFRQGIADFVVLGCPGCGEQLAVKNPFKASKPKGFWESFKSRFKK
jgi:hypothetical protein